MRIRHLPVRKSVAMALLLLLVHQAGLPESTWAAGTANCQEGPLAVNHWRGQAVSGGQKHGASGTVPGRVLAMCVGPGVPVEINGTFYFSNVEPVGGSFRDIVQIGFGQGRSPTLFNGMRYFTGYGRSTSTAGCSGHTNRDPLAVDAGAYVNAQHDFKVYHQTNNWRLLVDATQKLAIAEANICWTPGRATWFGETWDAGDQLGGTQANHLPVTLMNYANTEGGGFVFTNLNAAQACNYNANPPAVYRCDITGTRSIEIWTQDR